MNEAIFTVDSGTGRRTVHLSSYLDGTIEERAADREYAWIKALRHLAVDGEPLRQRFTYRGDSLWWFTELYLHKRRVVLDLFRATAALEHLFERERPIELRLVSGDRLVAGLAPQLARARHVRYEGRSGFGNTAAAIVGTDLRAMTLTYSALASRLRRRPLAVPRAAMVAFVHRAFWRGRSEEGSAESYIGAVLDALEHRLHKDDLRYVSVGPAENFSARRWWHALRPPAGTNVLPIESLAPLRSLRDSRRLWRARHRLRRALFRSDALRRHAIVDGIDWWPLVRVELAGVALLQWTWSARTMDEAAAALERLQPTVVVTYAEAGGWGRALVLECRRRGIRTAGLQHGFIYRHWLNYRHEADEMAADVVNADDRGFPRPDLTLVFDSYAAHHLETAGRFPSGTVTVTGSARLDGLVDSARSVSRDAVAQARAVAGATPSQALALFVAKFKQARRILPELVAAVAAMPDVQLAIKAHPAETPDVYDAVVSGYANVRVLPADAPLPALLGAARVVLTVNSTLALDAAVIGIPTLVLGLPNNLSPFVEAGALAGAEPGQIGPALHRILYDEGFREQLEGSRRVVLARFDMGSDGRAAARTAEALLALRDGDTTGQTEA